MRVFRNPAYDDPRFSSREESHFVSDLSARKVLSRVSQWDDYVATPLHSLSDFAAAARVNAVLYKDESDRFGLKSFKALGGAYAVDQLLIRMLRHRYPESRVSRDRLESGDLARECSSIVVAAATDGNHGRSVAWGAARRGCRCYIYLHAGVSKGRERVLRDLGAEVVRVKGNYDDSVTRVAEDAMSEGWHVVADTSTGLGNETPTDVMRGYSVMTKEIIDQLGELVPTHVFVQGGVGGLAGTVVAHFRDYYERRVPSIVVVEPNNAACLYESAVHGQPVKVPGDLNTVMAGLSCGEVSELAWPILSRGVNAFLTISDEGVAPTMRQLAAPSENRPSIEAGESAVAGLCALLECGSSDELRAELELTEDSRVVVFGTEGATDPEVYRRLVHGD